MDSGLSNEDKVVQTQLKEESKAQGKGFEVEESMGASASINIVQKISCWHRSHESGDKT